MERSRVLAFLLITLVVCALSGLFTWGRLTQEVITRTSGNTFLGGYGSDEIPYHEDATELEIRIEVDSSERLEFFLVIDIDYLGRPFEYFSDGPQAIRSGFAGGSGVVEWTVDREEFGDGTIYLVEDYTDIGDVPTPPTNTTYRTELSIKDHIDPTSILGFWVFVSMLSAIIILLILWVRDSRRQGPEEQWMPSKAVMPDATTPAYGPPTGPPDR